MKLVLCLFAITTLFIPAWAAPATVTVPTTASLENDIKDLLALFPKDKMEETAMAHLKNDTGFQTAIKYMQSKEWKDLVETVKSKPGWIAFKGYVKQAGINVDNLVKCIDKFLDNAKVDTAAVLVGVGDLRAFMIDIGQLVPTEKVLAYVNEKIIKSPNFQQLYDKLASNESRQLIEDVRAIPEVNKMIDILAQMGLDLNILFSAMYIFFGWK